MAKKKVNLELLKKLRDLLIFSLQNKDKVKQVYVGTVSPSLIRQAKKFGVDLTDTKIYIDSFAVRHSFNRHGVSSKSSKNGEFPICPFDLMFLPDLIQTGKVIGYDSECISIKKDALGLIGDIICEIRVSSRKGKRIYLKTMYNIKKKEG